MVRASISWTEGAVQRLGDLRSGGAGRAGALRALSRTGRRVRWPAVAFALLVAASAPAAEPAGPRALELTLDDAIRIALANNRSLQSARLRRETDRLSLAVAEERYHPLATVGADVRAGSERDESGELSVGPRIRVPTGGALSLRWSEPVVGASDANGMWTLSFSQPLLRGFGPDVDTAPVRVARIRERMNVLSFRDTVAGIVASVIGDYRRLMREHRAIVISRESLARARKQHEINRALISAGRMAEREIIQSEAEIANRELSLVERENSLNTANASLLSILDIDGTDRIIPVRETLDVERLRPDPERSIETALANRTDYLRAQLSSELAAIALDEAKNDRLWDLNLSTSLSRGSGNATDYGVSLGLNVPLGDRMSRTLDLLRAKHGLRDAEISLVELRESIRSDVVQAVHDVEVGFRRIELARKSRELAEQQLDVERSKLAQGLTSAWQLTRVEDDLVRAQDRELDAMVSYLGVLTSLDRTLGTTLHSRGIEVEEVEFGSDALQGAGAGRREIRLKLPAPAPAHRAVAVLGSGRLGDESPPFESPPRALRAVQRAPDAARARPGPPSRPGAAAGSVPVLLLSLREFASGTAVALASNGLPAWRPAKCCRAVALTSVSGLQLHMTNHVVHTPRLR